LKELKLKSWVKTSGASGLHIYVPIERNYTFETTRAFVSKIGSMIESLIPKKVTSSSLPFAERKGKVFIDPLQNSPTKTIVAPYSLRPLPKAPVSTPLEWRELEKDIKPTDFNINTIFERIEEKGDLFEETLTCKQSLEKAIEELGIPTGKK
jgi:bifunctional non-homologous end joining protein LigD